MKFEIKSWLTGGVLFSIETDSWKLAVEAAVKSGATLYGADLSGADLYGYICVGPIGSRRAWLWARWEEEKYIVHTGCFVGSLNEFEKRVKETHKDGIHREEYLLFIPLLRKRMESTEEENKWYLASKKK
jgi:hypothetical protein